MGTARGRSLHAALRRMRVAVLAALIVALSLLYPGVAAAADEVLTVTYPTTSAPAAGQVGDLVDVDVTTTAPGEVEGSFRPSGDDTAEWRPLDVVTLTPVVQPGSSAATALVPAGSGPGAYDLRLRLLAGDGSVLAEDEAQRALVVEDYRLPTGFETRDGASWTTHAEELAFLDAVQDSPRVAVDVLGESVQGRPLHLLRLGHPSPPSVEDAAEGRTVLLVCTQHGNEPAPRETCLRQIRRLAFTADSRTVDYLRSTTVFFVPTANPDGRELNTRGNADGLDLNRDHLRLVTVEAQAMSRALRDVRPDFFADLHEFGTSSASRPSLEVIWPRHLNVDEGVRSLGREWGDDWVRPRAEANGFSTGPYIANPGTGENITILNSAGLRHAAAVLTESRTSRLPGEPNDTAFVQRRRVATQDMAVHESFRFHRVNAGRIAAAVDTARERKIRAGLYRTGPYYWYGNSEDPGPPPDDAILRDPPCGYRLTLDQAASVQPWIDGFAVATVRLDDEIYVPMGQESQPVIGLMLDGRSAGSNEVEGRPWPSQPVRVPLRCATDRLGFEPPGDDDAPAETDPEVRQVMRLAP